MNRVASHDRDSHDRALLELSLIRGTSTLGEEIVTSAQYPKRSTSCADPPDRSHADEEQRSGEKGRKGEHLLLRIRPQERAEALRRMDPRVSAIRGLITNPRWSARSGVNRKR